MERMNFSVTSNHKTKLKEAADNEQIGVSEMLRRILDYYFSREMK